jgi:TonB family protein
MALQDGRRREMRRVLVVSLGAHLAIMGLFAWSPRLSSPKTLALQGVVTVEILEAPAGAAPAAAPKPRARPAKKTVVLPDKPKAAPKPKAKPAPKKVAKKPAKKKAPPPPQKSLADVMKELEKKSGSADEVAAASPRAGAPAGAVAGAGAVSGSARGVRVDPEVAGWMRRTRIHVRQSWVLAPGFRSQDLETHVSVRIDSGGRLQGGPRITRRSGNPWYDDSVVRALEKASPLPAPPEAGEWPFVFRPEDLL